MRNRRQKPLFNVGQNAIHRITGREAKVLRRDFNKFYGFIYAVKVSGLPIVSYWENELTTPQKYAAAMLAK